MKRLLLLLTPFLLLFVSKSQAAHIVGGEVTYEYLGNSQYEVTVVLYRDCFGSGAQFDDPASVGVFNSSNNLVQNLSFDLDSIVQLQSTINSSCVTAPNSVCTEAGYYTEIVTLPPILGGYTIAYQRCCRNPGIQNIQNPDDVGATYTANIPGSESSPENSSPSWSQLPPLYVCVNLPFQFNHQAIDSDGDSLVYSLCTPFEGGTTGAPQPNPPSNPPYNEILWEAPYSLTDMLGGPLPFTIDPITGELNAIPDAQGTFVVGLCVQEYRNGVLLGEVRRGFQLNVVNCQAPVALPDDINEISPNSFINCSEFVEFEAINAGGFDIFWDFGDPTTTADQSTNQSTSWTYPGPGTYDLTLVVFNPVNPNDPLCTDTTIQQVTIQEEVLPDAGPDTATCPGISIQIGTAATPGWTYSWSPTTGLDNPTAAQPNATITGQITYTVTATDAVGCTGTDEVTVSLLPNSSADAGPDVQICFGDSVQLGASGGVDYQWSPNVNISDLTIADPLVWPTTPQEYVVEVTNADGCVGSDTVLVDLFQPQLTVSADETICFGDTAQLTASGAVTYDWNPNVNISDNTISDPEVYPITTTTYVVDAVDVNGCEATDSITITIQQLPIADAGLDTAICDGESVQLQASGGTNYIWSPAGTLSNATIANPIATPTGTTTYTVTVSDQLGCESSDDVEITINPLPTANAGADGSVCNGVGTQLSASGGIDYSWTPTAGLDDATIFNPFALPAVPTDYVVEVTDANGCADTDTVFVDVFLVDAIGDTVICVGDAAQLGAIGGVSWTWTPTTDLTSSTAQFPIANPSTTTVYTVEADDGTGCRATDSVVVAVNQLPNAFAGFDQGVCAGNNAQLNATGGVTYEWVPGAGLSDANISNPVVTFSADTVTYVVVVSDVIGCQNTDTVTVWQEPLPDAQAGPDTTICVGETVQLVSSGGEVYTWSPTGGLSNPSVQNPTATPLVTTTYTVTVGQPTGNLVFNGDFSQGNVGFGSDYSYSNDLIPESRYGVVTDASTVHPAFVGYDHTGNAPLDSFMVVNGSGTPNQNVWCQTVSVSPNTDYFFGTWVSTVVGGNPAVLQFSINGQVLGSPFTAPFNTNNWIQFFETWNSGSATSATICVVNQNTTTGGNDFGLDDITFSTYCTSTAEVTVTVNELPEADAGEDQAICIGDTTQLEGAGGVTYNWIPPIGLEDPTNPTTDAYPTVTTNYILSVEDNIGCSDIDSVLITVNSLPPANAGPNQEICIGESVVLQGSGGTSYTWSPTTYLDDPNAQLPVSTAEQTTTYTVTVVDDNSCTNSDDVTITVNLLPVVDAGLDSTICADGSLVLQATGADSYLWSPLVGLSDPQSANPTASPLSPTTYFVTGTDVNGCENTDSVNITIFEVFAGPDSIICLNDSVQAFVSDGATFSWAPSEGVSDTASATPYLSPNGSTTFTVTATSAAGCESSADVTVDILTLPIAGFSATFEPSCDGIYAVFGNNSENSEDYFWNLGDGTTSSEFEPTHTFAPGAGSVVTLVTYNNDSLCADSSVVDYSGQMFQNDSIDIEYGTAFTPNFDGINDCFKPGFDGRFSDCYQLQVFNRWGALIFESTGGQEHCWDGHNKAGKRVDNGTYYYIVSLKGYEKHGYVTVIY